MAAREKNPGLGEALLSSASLRRQLGPEDLYVIESRGITQTTGGWSFSMTGSDRRPDVKQILIFQRTAFSTGASSLQGRKNLAAAGCHRRRAMHIKGKKARRIIVEDLATLRRSGLQQTCRSFTSDCSEGKRGLMNSGKGIKVDVVIVGASLAASAAAKRLVDAGLEVGPWSAGPFPVTRSAAAFCRPVDIASLSKISVRFRRKHSIIRPLAGA